MIKCNVTVCGTVSRQAQIRANRRTKQEQNPKLAWGMPCKEEEDEVNKRRETIHLVRSESRYPCQIRHQQDD